ncbi:uncharacterized protein FIBRA_08257 [Fibroporia radiculosa]|uniref:Vacuolar sorting protein 39/Transforming growth factor beta receptor-associated domain-containing protein n=1 Tax=Fibroporia radiculosa TaxID=599839 RepID=J4H528_9APHY|nr:uncharacterized protein FIBRA_08257 [Fibroporia radiculosa]CCM06014.1 predicted protein [Fibroporia radiculosa]
MATRNPAFCRANVLVLGSTSVQALIPSTLISQAEALLESHRVEDAADLADQQRKKLQTMVTANYHELEELHYVYQRLGFQCLTETLFDDAGRHLFAGELDPRVLIGYYPEFRGELFNAEDEVDVFAGVAEHMPTEGSIDEIITGNLVRNYSPHLSPNTRTAPPTVELRSILNMTACDMLEAFLRKWRTKAKIDRPDALGNAPAVRATVDTVLAKLYTKHEKPTDLRSIIDEPNNIVLAELEPMLIEARQYGVLCKLYRQRGEETKLLEAYSKLVDGEWMDAGAQDPLSSMFALLGEKRDRALVQRWGIWLTKRDPDRALKLLTSLSSGKRTADDDRALLQQIQEADATVGARYLEHLVLQKRSIDPGLHMQLATNCVDELLSCLADESTTKLWRAKASSYASGRAESSFLSYFASTTPDSGATRTRLKAILFLEGSTLYDSQAIRKRLVEYEKVLKFELAIVDGKLGEHRSALMSLVHELHDNTSAEIYCTLGGDIVPTKLAQSLGERFDLQQWASLLVPSSMKSKPSAVPMSRPPTVDGDLKKSLIRILLEVYMSGGEATAERTARFLNAQAMSLDVLDVRILFLVVISLIPPEWPLRIISTFVARSLRRTSHEQHEGEIVKAVSAAQNLAIAEQSWAVLREQGAIVEEALDDDGEDGSEKPDEKGLVMSFDEKTSPRIGEFVHPTSEMNGGAIDIDDERAKEALSSPHSGEDIAVGT